MKIEVHKGTFGTQWYVRTRQLGDRSWIYKWFDDVVKANGYANELRKASNDRLYLVQEEGIQTTERSEGVVAEGEEGIRRD